MSECWPLVDLENPQPQSIKRGESSWALIVLRFVDRVEELAALERQWRSGSHAFVVVYGRRRVGKTRLLQEFTRNKPGVFHVAAETSRTAQLVEFQHALVAIDPTLARAPFDSWFSILR
jgi:hypothetical protein